MDGGYGRVEGVDAEKEISDGLILLEWDAGVCLVVIEEGGDELDRVKVRMTHKDVNKFCWCVDHEDAAILIED